MAGYNKKLVEKVRCRRKSIINNDERVDVREILAVSLKKRGTKKAGVIMMNPSQADREQSDTSVNKVIEYIHSEHLVKNELVNGSERLLLDIKKLYIGNVIPVYETSSTKLKDEIAKLEKSPTCKYLKNIFDNNLNMIEKIIKNCDYVICAWGDCPDGIHATMYYDQILKMIKFIKKYKKKELFIFHVNNQRHKTQNKLTKKQKNPVHIINGGIISLLRIDFDEVNGITIWT